MVINYIRDAQIAAGVPRAQVYDRTMYVLAGMLAVGFVINLMIKPVATRWFMSDAEVAALQKRGGTQEGKSSGIGRGGLNGPAALAWLAVGIPILWGVWITFSNALKLFH